MRAIIDQHKNRNGELPLKEQRGCRQRPGWVPSASAAAAQSLSFPSYAAGCNMPATFFVLEAGTDCNLARGFWEQNSEVGGC